MTSAADLPEALEFLGMLRRARGPVGGLRLLAICTSNERAAMILRALEDSGRIECTGPLDGCPRALRGDLVGQMYQLRRSREEVFLDKW